MSGLARHSLLVGGLLGVGVGIAWWSGRAVHAVSAPLASASAALAEGPSRPASAAEFVGSRVCAGCHADQHTAWQRSQHARAMQHAAADTVLGDFRGTRLVYAGNTHRFDSAQGKYWVTTDGPDGRMQRYQVLYTFGLEPLQQYLVEAPGGRLQALPFAWDARAKSEGGQRWYHLHAKENVRAGDVLHWTAASSNWNHMCAECHSTRVSKGYDAAKDRFSTTWSEIGVGCEACHGGGARHLVWTEKRQTEPKKGFDVHFDERQNGEWTRLPSGTAQRSKAQSSGVEAATCAFCHSRRESLAQPFRYGAQLLASVSPELLTDPFYTADGVMSDEVFTYGSFMQSKMAEAGVTCSDCHEPHSGELRASGNAVCTHCHDAARFDAPSHHHHSQGRRSGARCLDCHMPPRTYMGVDVRRDHGFRVPRPDLSVNPGTPNACNDCHADKPSSWASQAVERWLGRPARSFQSYTEVFTLARVDAARVAEELRALARNSRVPSIARATALVYLRSVPDADTLRTLTEALHDSEPLARRAALTALEAYPSKEIARAALPLLSDAVLGVRIEAARILAGAPEMALSASASSALDEYVASQTLNADRAEAQNNLGILFTRTGDASAAEAAYLSALRIEPGYVPTYVNLADTYRVLGRDDEGLALLRRGLALAPNDAELLHSLGLALVRGGKRAEALEPLRRAARLDSANARFKLVYEAALAAAGKP